MIKKFCLQLLKARSSKHKQKRSAGFTLLELLVAMLIATTIVGTLLTFLVSVLETDRKEQAKSESQEEIQSALDYIADDMQEAIYIYDADGLKALNDNSSLPTPPLGTKGTPVLVFWKRHLYKSGPTDKIKLNPANPLSPEVLVSNLLGKKGAAFIQGGDQYVYSLVAYYLLKDDTPDPAKWSNTSRIARWEIRDGITNSVCDPGADANSCTATTPEQNRGGTPPDSTRYYVLPSPGFARFDTSGAGTLSQKMNKWKKHSDSYNPAVSEFTPLIDFVDDTPYTATQDDGSLGNSAIEVTVGPNTPAAPPVPSLNASCDNATSGVGNTNPFVAVTNPTGQVTQRIPAKFDDYVVNNPTRLSSFYACVNPSQVTARVYIRGNALARIQPNRIFREPVVNNSPFFPTANVRVNGRGSLINTNN
jgi:type II secretory pathway pseudopilin PulG